MPILDALIRRQKIVESVGPRVEQRLRPRLVCVLFKARNGSSRQIPEAKRLCRGLDIFCAFVSTGQARSSSQ